MSHLNTKRGFGKIWIIIIIFLVLVVGVYLLLAINWWPNDESRISVESSIITIDMKFDAEEAKVNEIKKLLENQEGVQSVSYFSPEQVLEETKSNNPDYFSNPNVLQTLNELGNPFGPRLVVKITDPSQKQSLIKFVQTKDGTPFSIIQLIK